MPEELGYTMVKESHKKITVSNFQLYSWNYNNRYGLWCDLSIQRLTNEWKRRLRDILCQTITDHYPFMEIQKKTLNTGQYRARLDFTIKEELLTALDDKRKGPEEIHLTSV